MHNLQKQAAQTRKAIEEIQRETALAREAAATAATAGEANRIALVERQEAERRTASLRAEQ